MSRAEKTAALRAMRFFAAGIGTSSMTNCRSQRGRSKIPESSPRRVYAPTEQSGRCSLSRTRDGTGIASAKLAPTESASMQKTRCHGSLPE
jgi:hypothetical protein